MSHPVWVRGLKKSEPHFMRDLDFNLTSDGNHFEIYRYQKIYYALPAQETSKTSYFSLSRFGNGPFQFICPHPGSENLRNFLIVLILNRKTSGTFALCLSWTRKAPELFNYTYSGQATLQKFLTDRFIIISSILLVSDVIPLSERILKITQPLTETDTKIRDLHNCASGVYERLVKNQKNLIRKSIKNYLMILILISCTNH